MPLWWVRGTMMPQCIHRLLASWVQRRGDQETEEGGEEEGGRVGACTIIRIKLRLQLGPNLWEPPCSVWALEAPARWGPPQP